MIKLIIFIACSLYINATSCTFDPITYYNATDKLYTLYQTKDDLINQLHAQTIRPKSRFTLRGALAYLIISGFMAGPGLTINYLNQDFTPITQQDLVNKVSLGLAGALAAPGLIGLSNNIIQSSYDAVMYDRNIQSIKAEQKKIQDKIDTTNNAIKKLKEQYPTAFDYHSLSSAENKTYQAFLTFYQNNSQLITTSTIETFLKNHPQTTISNLIKLLKEQRGILIIELYKGSSSGFFSVPNIDSVFMLMLPLYLIAAASGALDKTEENRKKEKIKTITLIDTMLKKLIAIQPHITYQVDTKDDMDISGMDTN